MLEGGGVRLDKGCRVGVGVSRSGDWLGWILEAIAVAAAHTVGDIAARRVDGRWVLSFLAS